MCTTRVCVCVCVMRIEQRVETVKISPVNNQTINSSSTSSKSFLNYFSNKCLYFALYGENFKTFLPPRYLVMMCKYFSIKTREISHHQQYCQVNIHLHRALKQEMNFGNHQYLFRRKSVTVIVIMNDSSSFYIFVTLLSSFSYTPKYIPEEGTVTLPLRGDRYGCSI